MNKYKIYFQMEGDVIVEADTVACKDIEGQAIAVADNYDNIVWER